jgi:phage shock protein A
MRLPKLEKVEADIADTKAKIAELTTKLRTLEKTKIDVENDKMIKALRAEKISDADLGALMESFRRTKNKQSPAETKATAEIQPRQEETHDANLEN